MKRVTRDEALFEFSKLGHIDERTLAEYLARYPEYGSDLMDLALSRVPLMDLEPTADDLDPQAAESIEAKTSIAAMLERMRTHGAASQLSQWGLLGTIKRLGRAPSSFAESLELGLSVLTKLDRRFYEPSTIPLQLLTDLSKAIDEPLVALLEYLNRPPTLALQASYRATARDVQEGGLRTPLRLSEAEHRVGLYRSVRADGSALDGSIDTDTEIGADHIERLDFAESVRDAPDMSLEQKAKWA